MIAPVRTLSPRALNRAVLARQLLLERSPAPLPRALERVAGIQAQYAPSMYVGLWSRLEGFEREALTRALERRSVVQGTLMRMTIHLVSRRDYWPLALAVRAVRRASWLRTARDASLSKTDASPAFKEELFRRASVQIAAVDLESHLPRRPGKIWLGAGIAASRKHVGHLCRDGQLDAHARAEVQGGARRLHALGHHLHAADDLREWTSARELDADEPVSAQ